MTKKHFAAIAAILANRIHEAGAHDGVVIATAEDLADYFATINPFFSRARFLAACKPEPRP